MILSKTQWSEEGIIGEASYQLLKLNVRFDMQDELINRRNTIIHQYDEFTDRIIWKHIQEDIPRLTSEISQLLTED